MIDWGILTDDELDIQFNPLQHCIVIDLPFAVTDAHPRRLAVRQMVMEELQVRIDAGEVPPGSTRCRFSHDGSFEAYGMKEQARETDG